MWEGAKDTTNFVAQMAQGEVLHLRRFPIYGLNFVLGSNWGNFKVVTISDRDFSQTWTQVCNVSQAI